MTDDAADLEDDAVDDAGDEPEPELEEESYAEIDPEIAEQVAAADADDADDDGADDADDEADDTDASSADSSAAPSPGHVYCKALGMGATISQQRMGSGVDDRSEAIEDYAQLAKELDLDDYFDEWYAENIGGSGEVSPGQGIVAFTSLFAVMVLVEDAEMLDGAIDSMNDLSTETEAA